MPVLLPSKVEQHFINWLSVLQKQQSSGNRVTVFRELAYYPALLVWIGANLHFSLADYVYIFLVTSRTDTNKNLLTYKQSEYNKKNLKGTSTANCFDAA